jgi:hypothetical protein
VLGIGGDFGEQLNSFDDLTITSNDTSTKISLVNGPELVTLDGVFDLNTSDFVFQIV